MTDKTPSALITRPYPEAYRTMDYLTENNIHSIIEPMINIEPIDNFATKWQEIPLDNIQAIITTSKNGVRALASVCKHKHITIYTVGDGSKETAENIGFDNVISASGSANDLYNVILERHNPEDGGLVYVSGDIVSVDLTTQLQDKNFLIHHVTAYQAKPVTIISPALQHHLINRDIDIALFFSEQTAKIFEKLIIQNNLETYTNNVSAFCLSEKIEHSLQRTKWLSIYTANKPNQSSLLDMVYNFHATL